MITIIVVKKYSKSNICTVRQIIEIIIREYENIFIFRQKGETIFDVI